MKKSLFRALISHGSLFFDIKIGYDVNYMAYNADFTHGRISNTNYLSMKQALKFIGVFILSIIGGFIIGQLAVVIFTDLTLAESLHKLADVEILELAGVALSCMAIFIAAIFLQLLLHEGGHLVGGLISGYKFVSFRVFNFTFIKENGKLKVKNFKIEGTGGQCLLTPPDMPADKVPTKLYNIAGILSNLLFSVLAIAVWLVLAYCCGVENFFIGYTAVVFAGVGVFFAILNGIPMKVGGISNDGNNVKLLDKEPSGKEAFVIQLKANALVQQGVTPKDMPAEWFERESINYENMLETSVMLMRTSYLMDIDKMEEAHLLLEEIYSHKEKLMGLMVKEIECELVFTSLVTGRKARAEELLTPELKKYIEAYRKAMSSKERILWAVARYIENDTAKAQQILESLSSRQSDYLMQGEVKMDLRLIEQYNK